MSLSFDYNLRFLFKSPLTQKFATGSGGWFFFTNAEGTIILGGLEAWFPANILENYTKNNHFFS